MARIGGRLPRKARASRSVRDPGCGRGGRAAARGACRRWNSGVAGDPAAGRSAAEDRPGDDVRAHSVRTTAARAGCGPANSRRPRRWRTCTPSDRRPSRRAASATGSTRCRRSRGWPGPTTNRAPGRRPAAWRPARRCRTSSSIPAIRAHVLAVAAAPSDGGVAGAGGGLQRPPTAARRSRATPLYTAAAGATIVGVEIARSNPRVIYVAAYTTTATGRAPVLARSTDGGASWTTTPLTASVGRGDRAHPGRRPAGQRRRLPAGHRGRRATPSPSRETAGGTVAVPVTFARGQLSAFARLSSGTVLVGALIATDAGGTDGTAVRSTDGGTSFQPWTTLPAPTHLVGLAERVENGRPAPLPFGQELQRRLGAGGLRRRRRRR